MGGNTITTPATRVPAASLAQSRAARELGLKRGEFELAVRLGRVRTVPAADGGRRRVAREEIERVRDTAGFPDSLRERVRAVGTTEGAGLMDITTARFTPARPRGDADAGRLLPFDLGRAPAFTTLLKNA